jgi:NAD(P)-dependent dehydrogenase (short-subunit alcohol dehydrogenase family)
MESLHAEVAPFGITTTVVNPGVFRTELLTEQSTNDAEPSIKDYDERRRPLVEYWKSQNRRQSGDPAKLARALIISARIEPSPRDRTIRRSAIGPRSSRPCPDEWCSGRETNRRS